MLTGAIQCPASLIAYAMKRPGSLAPGPQSRLLTWAEARHENRV
jgi:hypothetical protein